jgi:phosphoribosyl-AMP cyclohydrolase
MSGIKPKTKKLKVKKHAAVSKLKFDKHGLIPAVIQDKKSGQILMVAYMNKLSLKKTLATGLAHYWSRSRKCLWLKGETSGHFQKVKQIYFDCDKDTLLIKIEQIGVACHTGERSCFFTQLV